ncbi:MAG: hypothetical protein NT068_00950 [Candidatus Nomurabacteria bacterium]|nr:hypothetical protein [Candidatus Nomurabacteria bacterium]
MEDAEKFLTFLISLLHLENVGEIRFHPVFWEDVDIQGELEKFFEKNDSASFEDSEILVVTHDLYINNLDARNDTICITKETKVNEFIVMINLAYNG